MTLENIENIETILYASDLKSKDARKAFRIAVRHATAHNAKLVFLHAIGPIGRTAEMAMSSFFSDDEIEKINTEGLQKVQDVIKKRIHDFCDAELVEESRLKQRLEILIEKGMPAETVLHAADKINADMIIMGTRTHNKLSQMVLGSTAHQVLFHASCPVLVVPLS